MVEKKIQFIKTYTLLQTPVHFTSGIPFFVNGGLLIEKVLQILPVIILK